MKNLGDDAILGLDLGDVFDSIMLKHITSTRERKVEPVVSGSEVVQRNEGVKIKHPDEALRGFERA